MRVTPGDSLRLDMMGPLGAGRGAAFVVGDSQHWAEPEEEVRKVAPNFPLLWAMLGIPRLPARFSRVERYQDAALVAWRFIDGADTVDVARFAGAAGKLVTEVRQGGSRLGRVETLFNPDGALRSARLDMPEVGARLQLEYYGTQRQTAFPPDTWLPPERQP